jgi:hypothetical protein
MYSARTNSYVEAMIKEGDNFNYDAWLRRVRAEEATAKTTKASPPMQPIPSCPDQALPGLGRPAERVFLPIDRCSSRSSASCTQRHLAEPDPMGQELLRVCDAWDKFEDSRTRDSVYVYLKGVYSAVTDYRRKRQTAEFLRRAFKFAGLTSDSKAEPFAAIIRCTSEQSVDIRTISKWSRALRYAAYRKRAPRNLKRFIKRLGGINGCADGYTKRLGRRRRRN